MKKNDGLKKPFFAGFLENQIQQEDAHSVQGGIVTTPALDLVQTLKYPSDQEDNPTKPILDMVHTLKYPSDGDEDGPILE
jgi:hypothetical protein